MSRLLWRSKVGSDEHKKSYHLLSPYYVPGETLDPLYTQAHLDFIGIIYPYVTVEENGVSRH